MLLYQCGELLLLAKHGEIQGFHQVFYLGQFDFDFSQPVFHGCLSGVRRVEAGDLVLVFELKQDELCAVKPV